MLFTMQAAPHSAALWEGCCRVTLRAPETLFAKPATARKLRYWVSTTVIDTLEPSDLRIPCSTVLNDKQPRAPSSSLTEPRRTRHTSRTEPLCQHGRSRLTACARRVRSQERLGCANGQACCAACSCMVHIPPRSTVSDHRSGRDHRALDDHDDAILHLTGAGLRPVVLFLYALLHTLGCASPFL